MSGETKKLLSLVNHLEDEKLKDAKKTYEEFKRLRESLGKPVAVGLSRPKEIEENLSSREFWLLIRELKAKKRGSRSKRR